MSAEKSRMEKVERWQSIAAMAVEDKDSTIQEIKSRY